MCRTSPSIRSGTPRVRRAAGELQENRYNASELFGVGYVRTKQSIVSPWEQMVLYGLQTFPSGTSITWVIKLE